MSPRKTDVLMKTGFLTVCNLQAITSHKQEGRKEKLLLKQNSNDLNQIRLVVKTSVSTLSRYERGK